MATQQLLPRPLVEAPVPSDQSELQDSVGSSSLTGWISFALMHIAALGVFFVGWSWPAVAMMVAMYVLRMFAITGFYHRYFSHRSFKTSRWLQFGFALLGASSCQQGPLWWAAHHRHHHKFSDQPEDLHSPRQKGFWYSHIAWVVQPQNHVVDYKKIPDFAKYPELVWLDKYHMVAPVALGLLMLGLGALLQPLGTHSLQMLFWGFFASTVLLWHGTFTINSLSHVFGSQRYDTGDDSRNNPLFALLTLGEGWHNNHHFYMTSTRQGFYWWEFDITFYGLWLMSKLGLVWDLKKVPAHIKARHKQ
ncbi:MAG: acyl-CoA desaturase [Candidatus Melainabacteria bacterium HGW-Melainabacteria-1]|nr:MAG: acyl-CoA desaturase [Candidatus Melainabacteria bacterium HGW-Melainabacteria-1]